MSTNDVPGANPTNKDVLAAGCWAEHSDGSLIYIKGTERNLVVYEIYDLAHDPPVYYQDAMRDDAFKKQFSFPPIGQSGDKWTWHDKTPFPWDRVMKTFERPTPQMADVHDQLSAAARVAQSLRLRAEKVSEETFGGRVEQVRSKTRGLLERLESALRAFSE